MTPAPATTDPVSDTGQPGAFPRCHVNAPTVRFARQGEAVAGVCRDFRSLSWPVARVPCCLP
ncbi:hypothetical protein GCM10010335_61700 [Streptomyces galbus]|nr:hypothetical protein GCM10010335_61700 [Streptomyces galbus]